jgi:putative ABC transport system permease protein
MLSLSMVIMGGTMMMTASFEELFNETMDEQENWDSQAYMWPTNAGEIELWAQQNASGYELLIRSSGNATDDPRVFTIYGLENIVSDESAMHRFNVVKGEIPTIGQNPPQVLIDEGMASELDWDVSDRVKISQGSAEIEVEVTGIVRELERTMVFYRTDYSPIVGWDANGIRLTFDEGQQLDDDVRSLTSVVITKKELLTGFNEVLKQQEKAMKSTYMIGAIMAVAILFNTLMMNLAERDNELATLRVLGASIKDLAIILTIEHAFIGLVGGIAGVATSILMFQGMASTFSTWQFFMPATIDQFVALKVLLFIFIASLATTPFGMWRIRKMDLLDVVSRHQN